MNAPANKGHAVLTDYVDLFKTLNPDDTAGYIKTRLTSFREGLTVRKEVESRRIVQELLTLFPRLEVYLEAARYYRLVKEPEESIRNYLRFLSNCPNEREIISDLAEVCITVPQAALTGDRHSIVQHLSLLGAEHMDARVLALFCSLAKSPDHLQSIVTAIESDAAKLSTPEFRNTLFRALDELHQWKRLVASATDIDLNNPSMQRILAKAYAKLHLPDKALQIVHRLPLREVSELLPILEILFDLRQDTTSDEIRKAIEGNRYLRPHLNRYALNLVNHPSLAQQENAEFRSWLQGMLNEKTST